MAEPAVIIRNILTAVPSFGTAGDTVFIGRPPGEPTKLHVVVTASGGRPPWPHFALDFPSVQVMVRGIPDGYQAAYTKIRQVKNALLGYPSSTIGTDRLVAVNQIGDINWLGYDERNCPLFSTNWSLIIESQADNGYRQVIT